MPQIIREMGLGGSLGSALGTGLANLIQDRLQKIQQRNIQKQQISGLQTLLGFSDREASSLASLDPQIQKEFIKQKMAEPSQQAFAQALSGLTGAPTVQQPVGGEVPATGIEAQLSGLKPQQATQLAQLGIKREAMTQRAEQFQERQQQALEMEKAKSKTRMLETGYKAGLKATETGKSTVQTLHDSIRANQDVLRLLDTGKVETGPGFALKTKLGIEKWATTPETQSVAKILAAEPIRSLKSIPGQAARLSKVFDTIKDMTPQLMNSEGGLRQIAKIRIADSKALKLFEQAKLRELERYRKAKKVAPFDIDEKVTKKIQPQLDKYYKTVENLANQAKKMTSGAKLKMGQTIESLPDPGLNKDVTILDDVTGKYLKSNGTEWLPEGR